MLHSWLRPPKTLSQIAQASPGGAINKFVAILLPDRTSRGNPSSKDKGSAPVEVWIKDAYTCPALRWRVDTYGMYSSDN